VRFAGLIHPGILGCAPSQEVLELWNKREGELITACAHMDRDVAKPPEPINVHAGTASEEIKAKVGREGARTIPGRPEHGGNCDIKNLSRGSRVFLPVHVKGAKFSVGHLLDKQPVRIFDADFRSRSETCISAKETAR
jgi:formamidase